MFVEALERVSEDLISNQNFARALTFTPKTVTPSLRNEDKLYCFSNLKAARTVGSANVTINWYSVGANPFKFE